MIQLMITLKKSTRRVTFTAIVSSLFALVFGCGDDGFGKRYPVSGNVTYKDEPVAKGSITFTPVNPGRPASGAIQNGRYSLTTVDPEDGALAGQYKVTIMAKDVDYASLVAKAKGSAIRQPDIIKAGASAKLMVPQKYQLPDTSGLTATVEEKSNTLNFKLTD